MEVRNYNKLSVSEILSRSFNILNDNILNILKVVGIYIVPTTVVLSTIIFGVFITSFLRFAFMSSYLDIDDVFGMMSFGSVFLVFISGIISSLILAYANSIIIKIIDDANKGNEVSFKSANSYVWQRKWRVVGLNVLVYLILTFSILIFVVLGLLISALTLGIGLIVFIPAMIAIGIIVTPLMSVFNSMLIVNDINITDAIRETFLLFRKGYFWSTIGYISAISGITIGVGILIVLLSAIPFLGFFITIIGQFLIQLYLFAYTTIYVLDRTKHFEGNNNYRDYNSYYNNQYNNTNNYSGMNNNYNNSNNYSGVNNDYNGLNRNYDSLINNEDNNNRIEEVDSTATKNNDKVDDNNNDGFIDPIN